jgi:hypothetical protein
MSSLLSLILLACALLGGGDVLRKVVRVRCREEKSICAAQHPVSRTQRR